VHPADEAKTGQPAADMVTDSDPEESESTHLTSERCLSHLEPDKPKTDERQISFWLR
jgi:hypothetical protein